MALTSSHGMACEMPMLESIHWRFSHKSSSHDIGVVDDDHQHQQVKSEDMVHNSAWARYEHQSAPGESENICGGETYVYGSEGPAIIAANLPEGIEMSHGAINLHLTPKAPRAQLDSVIVMQ